MGTISAKQLKEPKSPKEVKCFRLPTAITALLDNLENGALVQPKAESVVTFFFSTSYSIAEADWWSPVHFTYNRNHTAMISVSQPTKMM